MIVRAPMTVVCKIVRQHRLRPYWATYQCEVHSSSCWLAVEKIVFTSYKGRHCEYDDAYEVHAYPEALYDF